MHVDSVKLLGVSRREEDEGHDWLRLHNRRPASGRCHRGSAAEGLRLAKRAGSTDLAHAFYRCP
jgi:hypothetical protein